MLSAVVKNICFGVLTAFLTTAMYHFATNEPQSYVLGGESTLYIVTLDWLLNSTRRPGHPLTIVFIGKGKSGEITGKKQCATVNSNRIVPEKLNTAREIFTGGIAHEENS